MRVIKKIIKFILSSVGLKISRIPNQDRRSIFTKTQRLKIGAIDLKLGRGHALPTILQRWPNYSSNLPRLASKIKHKYPQVILIDIGANVGDTVALLRQYDYFPIVCIEGDDIYFDLLKQNMSNIEGISIYKYFLGEQAETIHADIKKQFGTAQIIKSNNKVLITTLDTFIDAHDSLNSAKILKIDTDGYDLKIIKGGLKYIQKTKPILFIEYDSVFFSKVGDDGISTLNILKDIGYNKIIFYDNFGRFLLATELVNTNIITQLHSYIDERRGAFPYYDLCIFHNDDEDIALECIKSEINFSKNI